MSAMMVFVLIVAVLAALDVASILWGADSRDGPDSPEWERRRHWPSR